MTNMTPSLQYCRVIGRWITGDHAGLRPGTYTATYPRTRNTKQKAIAPAGVYAKGALNTDPGTPLPVADTDPIVGASFNMLLPATDDADLRDALKVQLDFTFGDGGASETYVIDLPSNGTIYLDDIQPTVIGAIPAPTASSLKLGLAGGVALLNGAGQVIDAAGVAVTGGGGAGTVTAVNGKTPVSGVITLVPSDIGAATSNAAATAQAAASTAQTTANTAATAAATAQTSANNRVRYDADTQGLNPTQQANARTNIGAGTSNLALGTTSTTAKAGDWTPTLTNIPAGVALATPTATRPSSRTDMTCIFTSATPDGSQITGDAWLKA